jgi:hypothetical protein
MPVQNTVEKRANHLITRNFLDAMAGMTLKRLAGLSSSVATVAQLVEHRLVVPVVAGSSPVGRPIF